MLNKNQRYEYCTVDFLCKSLHTCTNMMANIIETKNQNGVLQEINQFGSGF